MSNSFGPIFSAIGELWESEFEKAKVFFPLSGQCTKITPMRRLTVQLSPPQAQTSLISTETLFTERWWDCQSETAHRLTKSHTFRSKTGSNRAYPSIDPFVQLVSVSRRGPVSIEGRLRWAALRKGDKTDFKNYKPVCLTSSTSKVLGRIVQSQIWLITRKVSFHEVTTRLSLKKIYAYDLLS